MAASNWRKLPRALVQRIYLLFFRPLARPLLRRLRTFMSLEIIRTIQEQRNFLAVEIARGIQERFLDASGEGRLASGDASFAPRLLARPPIRIVHQFHSGSASGDAITNSMLLIQRLLRGLEFESEIFVEHRDPRLADRLRLVDELPQHPQYILIVHHSMGFDCFDRVAASPAVKILLYHNITPAEFFPNNPHVQRYIRLGHEQLNRWRPMISAALADSEYNAIELRRLGYEPVHACQLLFDVERMLAERSEKRGASNEPYTILFVGRIAPSKGQADLVDAFAAFRAAFGKPCRLVLVGRDDEVGPNSYTEQIRKRARGNGISDFVILTGLLSDELLHNWYRRADLYVSLSHHEGFGVPLVEAMAHRIPVIAWAAGAIPYTLDGAGELMLDRSSEVAARAMLRLATDVEHRNAVIERQCRALERFKLERQMPQLLAALHRAGAALPQVADVRQQLVSNMWFTITGHVNGSYSLAHVNRTMATALEAHSPGKVRILPVETNPTVELSGVPPAQRPAIEKFVARPKLPTSPHVLISHHYPPYVPNEGGDLTMALVFWEEALLPEGMVDTVNQAFGAVLAPSSFVAKALIDSGIRRPVVRTGNPAELAEYFQLGEERKAVKKSGQLPFTFLHVSSCFPRKGVDVLLAAYFQAFTNKDPVQLIIKGFPNPHNNVAAQIEKLRGARSDYPKVALIDKDVEDDSLLDLYRQADAVVLPTRGEGFNLPAAEAMAAGIPLIVTGYGGHRDFCTADDARLIEYRFERSRSHVASAHSLWVEPSLEDLTNAMRELFGAMRNGDKAIACRAERARIALRQRLSQSAWSENFTNIAADLLVAPPTRPFRLGWVSSWNVRCGVATYSNFLLGEMLKQDRQLAARTIVFADDRPAEQTARESLRSLQSWRVGGDHTQLAAAIAVEDVDVLVVQHQTGLIPWRTLASLLRDARLENRQVVVMLHAVPELGTAEEIQQEVIGALRNVARVLVHTIADLNLLKKLGLMENVTLFPHGAAQSIKARPAQDLPSNITGPLIGCYGFFLPDKGISRLVEAAAALRQHWPSLRLRLVNARYPEALSADEIAACQATAAALGINEAIQWMTDYLPHEASIHLLSECDVVVLPYTDSTQSVSGAVRVALASGAPVATTRIGLFEELDDAVARLPNSSTEEFANALRSLLMDVEMRRHLQKAASVWLEEHRWSHLARRLHGMLSGLHATAPRQRPLCASLSSRLKPA